MPKLVCCPSHDRSWHGNRDARTNCITQKAPRRRFKISNSVRIFSLAADRDRDKSGLENFLDPVTFLRLSRRRRKTSQQSRNSSAGSRNPRKKKKKEEEKKDSRIKIQTPRESR